VQPGCEPGIPVKGVDGPEGGDERILHCIFAVLRGIEKPRRDREHFGAEIPHEAFEGGFVATAQTHDQFGFARWVWISWLGHCRGHSIPSEAAKKSEHGLICAVNFEIERRGLEYASLRRRIISKI
jgi:hypothetical protein